MEKEVASHSVPVPQVDTSEPPPGSDRRAFMMRSAMAAAIATLTGRPVQVAYADWRAGDQRYYVSDMRRAARELGLNAPRPWREGIAALAEWLQRAQDERLTDVAEPALS